MSAYPHRGLHAHIVQSIATEIVSGKLAPDDTLDIDEIGRRFDVSRTVVREAVKVLTAKGLVDARPKRGTFIRPRSNWNLLDPDVLRWQFEGPDGPTTDMLDKLAEVRLIVEPPGAALAAANRTDEDLLAIEGALDQMAEANEELDVITTADSRFHRAVLQASGNELLGEMAIIIEAGLYARNSFVHRHDVPLGPSVQAHRAVLDAIRNHDPQRAEFEMRALIVSAAKDVERIRGRR